MTSHSQSLPVPDHFHQALANVPWLKDVPIEVKASLARIAIQRRYPAGQNIYLEGEPAGSLFILAAGWVKATRVSPDGREQAMLFLRSGEVFGDIAVLTGTPYPATVTALEPVEAFAIDGSAFFDLVRRYPDLAMAVIRHLGERVLFFIGTIEDLSLRSVESRLAVTLLKHAERDGERLIVPRRNWTTFNEMAVRLGTVRDVLRRALQSLEADGLLQVERRAIVILDPERLEQRGKG